MPATADGAGVMCGCSDSYVCQRSQLADDGSERSGDEGRQVVAIRHGSDEAEVERCGGRQWGGGLCPLRERGLAGMEKSGGAEERKQCEKHDSDELATCDRHDGRQRQSTWTGIEGKDQ